MGAGSGCTGGDCSVEVVAGLEETWEGDGTGSAFDDGSGVLAGARGSRGRESLGLIRRVTKPAASEARPMACSVVRHHKRVAFPVSRRGNVISSPTISVVLPNVVRTQIPANSARVSPTPQASRDRVPRRERDRWEPSLLGKRKGGGR
jgi:hypothetical protein